MDDYGPVLRLVETVSIGIALLAIIALPCFIWLVRWQRNRRTQRVREAAEAAGWQWQPGEPALTDSWPLAPFGIGSQRTVRNVIRGSHHGRGFIAFEYSYVETEPGGERRRDFAVYVSKLSGTLPVIQAGPKDTPVGQLTSALGFHDVPERGDQTDQGWRFRTANEEFAAALLDDRMREALRDGETWSWGFAGDSMVAAHPGPLQVHEITSWLDRMGSVRDRISDEVWRGYGKG